MKSVLREERLTELIRSSLKLMCKTSLDYEKEVKVQGTLGVTLDNRFMFLITIDEAIHCPNNSFGADTVNSTFIDNSSIVSDNAENDTGSITSRNSPLYQISASPMSEKSIGTLKRANSVMEENDSFEAITRSTNITNQRKKLKISNEENLPIHSQSSQKLVEPVVVAPYSEVKQEDCSQQHDSENFALFEERNHSSPDPQLYNQPSHSVKKVAATITTTNQDSNNYKLGKNKTAVCSKHNKRKEAKHAPNKVNKNNKKISLLPLPDFSGTVKKNLHLNNRVVIWDRMIHEAAEYYFTKRPQVLLFHNQEQVFQEIAEAMYKKFPAIGCSDFGDNQWSRFSADLYKRVMYLKTSSGLNNSGENNMPQELINDNNKIEVMKEMYQNLKKNLNSSLENKLRSELRQFLEITHVMRRKWIETMHESGSVQAILEVFPLFQDPEFVGYEMELIKGRASMTEIENKCEELFNNASLMVASAAEKDDMFDLEVFQFLERETCLVAKASKTNNSGTKPVIKVYEDLSDELILQTKSSTLSQHSPSLLVFLNDRNIKDAVILTDGDQMQANCSTFRKCILSLLYVYYIAWIDYPREYSQVLGLFQQIVIGETFTEKKTKLTNFFQKWENKKKTTDH